MLRDIERLYIRKARVEEKIKKIEVKLRKYIEINEEPQATKKQLQAKSDIGDVIRRRKGEPEKRISLKLNKQ